jgi:putative aminophosphonate oxidoreductase
MTKSLWLEEALDGEEDAPLLEREEQADVCIVGGGYTGLWTALRLKEDAPDLDVVIVEADVCGGGPSGRNGGFVMSMWSKILKLEHLCGDEEALRVATAAADAVGAIGAFCEQHGIDAHFRYDGWLWAATSEAQFGAWDETVEAAERLGVQAFVRLDAEEAAARGGSPTHLAGVFEPTCATVQPALLARGLRRVALDRGVRIFEHSPMTRLERSSPPRVHSTLGAVTAATVVLAMNAWLAQLPEVSRSLAVIASDMVATAPIPDRLEEIGLTSGIAISDSRLLVNYYRTTLDGRIAFGRGGGALTRRGRIGPGFSGPSPRAGEIADSFRSIYPTLADVDVPVSWNGPIDRSLDGLPFFGRLRDRPDLLFGGGYSGNGVGPSYLGGRILASLALGLDDEWTRSPLAKGPHGRFPPGPIKDLGAPIVRSAVARKERAEDAGRRPGRVSVYVAGLAPAGLVPVKKP